MTLSGAKARFQLNATATPTGTLVTGPNVIGQGLGTASFSDADIAYSFKVTATGAADVATLTFSSGVVAQTTGTPTITDGDGNDFEGVTLPTMASLYGILVDVSGVASGFRFLTSGSSEDIVSIGVLDYSDASTGGTILQTMPNGVSIGAESAAIHLEEIGDSITVTVIGKSS